VVGAKEGDGKVSLLFINKWPNMYDRAYYAMLLARNKKVFIEMALRYLNWLNIFMQHKQWSTLNKYNQFYLYQITLGVQGK
jgi:hypothetical protein